ncbi:MAG TPA: hypothetical protein VLM80_01240 [Anaerolineales bacterium]|nr:hypothetical protein [Anaerolineales bacterium]
MIEIPEAAVLAKQLNQTITGKHIQNVVAAHSPHKFAWYAGDPAEYPGMLTGKTIGVSRNWGGMVEIQADDHYLLMGDGVNVRFFKNPADLPTKHQLWIEFADSSSLIGSVAMYGGLWCFKHNTFDNPYYLVAKEKPSPLTSEFDNAYFSELFLPEREKLSLKAFLATEQRVPGLGNGVLQDILYNANLHPKRKIASLNTNEREGLFSSIKDTLIQMTEQGGRDTERDLFGEAGGYATRVSKNTVGKSCPHCDSLIVKEAYMGGSIYFCPGCQKVS